MTGFILTNPLVRCGSCGGVTVAADVVETRDGKIICRFCFPRDSYDGMETRPT